MPTLRPELRHTVVADHLVLHDAATHRTHVLNPTSARIWAAVDGRSTTDEISRSLADETSADRAVVARDVALTIEQFAAAGIIRPSAPEYARPSPSDRAEEPSSASTPSTPAAAVLAVAVPAAEEAATTTLAATAAAKASDPPPTNDPPIRAVDPPFPGVQNHTTRYDAEPWWSGSPGPRQVLGTSVVVRTDDPTLAALIETTLASYLSTDDAHHVIEVARIDATDTARGAVRAPEGGAAGLPLGAVGAGQGGPAGEVVTGTRVGSGAEPESRSTVVGSTESDGGTEGATPRAAANTSEAQSVPVGGAVDQTVGGFRMFVDGVVDRDVATRLDAVEHMISRLNQLAVAGTPGRLLLHAGVVERGGRAVVVVGPSGRGKSTLTAALMLTGFDYLSDEVAAIDPVTGWVDPFTKPLSLSNATRDLLGVAVSNRRAEDDRPRAKYPTSPDELGSVSGGGHVDLLVLLEDPNPPPPLDADASPAVTGFLALLEQTFAETMAVPGALEHLGHIYRETPVLHLPRHDLATMVRAVTDALA